MQISKTAVGLIVYLLGILFSWKGVPVADGQLETIVTQGFEFVGGIVTLWGQFSRKDLIAGVIRK